MVDHELCILVMYRVMYGRLYPWEMTEMVNGFLNEEHVEGHEGCPAR